MDDEARLGFRKRGIGLSETRVSLTENSRLVDGPHLVRDVSRTHLGLQSTEHSRSPDIHRQADDTRDRSP